MTQPQRGPSRAEVSDLRNIVDRLDLLMGGPGSSSDHPGGRSPRDAITAMAERVETLEGEVEELRTLVNHLMTIATWQAKVTATLVNDRAADDVADGDEQHETTTATQYGTSDNAEEYGRHHDSDGARSQRHGVHTSLDDDIDDILGGERSSSQHDSAPPDFGI